MTTTAPTVPPVVVPGQGSNIILNPLQKGNPILEHVKNVGKEFGDIVADFQVGRTTGVLFLSLKYHRLHPEYIHTRIEKLGQTYNLRILLILCDITEHRDPIRELTKMCLINNITVIVAFSSEEAGLYLSTFKQFEHKPPNMIKERVDKDYPSMLRTSLTSISKVNKTDVETLRMAFGSFAGVSKASSEQLQELPGFGQVKVKNVKNAFDKPFRNMPSRTASSMASRNLWQGVGAMDSQRTARTQEKTAAPARPAREPSPVWDIERDLSSSPEPSGATRARAESPPWDIELDLN